MTTRINSILKILFFGIVGVVGLLVSCVGSPCSEVGLAVREGVGAIAMFIFIILFLDFDLFNSSEKKKLKVVPAGREETMRIVKELKRKNPETLKLLEK